jgi:hypothetical protein
VPPPFAFDGLSPEPKIRCGSAQAHPTWISILAANSGVRELGRMALAVCVAGS